MNTVVDVIENQGAIHNRCTYVAKRKVYIIRLSGIRVVGYLGLQAESSRKIQSKPLLTFGYNESTIKSTTYDTEGAQEGHEPWAARL